MKRTQAYTRMCVHFSDIIIVILKRLLSSWWIAATPPASCSGQSASRSYLRTTDVAEAQAPFAQCPARLTRVVAYIVAFGGNHHRYKSNFINLRTAIVANTHTHTCCWINSYNFWEFAMTAIEKPLSATTSVANSHPTKKSKEHSCHPTWDTRRGKFISQNFSQNINTK